MAIDSYENVDYYGDDVVLGSMREDGHKLAEQWAELCWALADAFEGVPLVGKWVAGYFRIKAENLWPYPRREEAPDA